MITPEKIGNYRWVICGLLFAATTINYMDRSVLGVLAPTLQYKVFNWTDNNYATITNCFTAAYALGMLVMGAIIDKFGTKIGYTLAITIWSISGMLHATIQPAFGLIGFCLARFGLGFGESGNFPAAIKTVAEWFPKKERALAVGILNAGTNIGATLAPLVIPLVVLTDGTHWQYAFLTTGVFSAIWVVVWLKVYQHPEIHPRLTKTELAYIQSGSRIENTAKIRWIHLLPLRETWAFAVLKITDAAWWFYLFWVGKFLFDQFGLDIKGLALPLIIIYVIADFGSIMGGWLSAFFIKKGWPINRARKTTLFICALFILPVTFTTKMGTHFDVNGGFFEQMKTVKVMVTTETTVDGVIKQVRTEEPVSLEMQTALRAMAGKSFASAKEFIQAVKNTLTPEQEKLLEAALIKCARSDNLYWIAVLLIGLAMGGHQAWSANVFTVVSDLFPKKATASVTGIGGMLGGVSGIVANYTLGKVLTDSGPSGYFWAFLAAGCCYLMTLLASHLLSPKLIPLDENLLHIST